MSYEPLKIPKYINKLVRNKHKANNSPLRLAVLRDSLLYVLLMVFIVVIVALHSVSQGSFYKIFGYSAMTVVGSSMQEVLPQHSLIIVKEVDSQTIKIGDDISYLTADNLIITHQVSAIIENYDGNNQRGFQTRGTNNKNADLEIVVADAIIGRVIYHNLAIGKILVFIKDKFFYLLGCGLLFVGVWQLQSIFHKRKENRV